MASSRDVNVASAAPPHKVNLYKPNPQLGFEYRQVYGFEYAKGCVCPNICEMVRLWGFLFLAKRRKDVGNVGRVAQPGKSPQKSQLKVFRNCYTAYIGNIIRLGGATCHAIEGRLRNGVNRPRLAFLSPYERRLRLWFASWARASVTIGLSKLRDWVRMTFTNFLFDLNKPVNAFYRSAILYHLSLNYITLCDPFFCKSRLPSIAQFRIHGSS